jgi:hypothetical protein
MKNHSTENSEEPLTGKTSLEGATRTGHVRHGFNASIVVFVFFVPLCKTSTFFLIFLLSLRPLRPLRLCVELPRSFAVNRHHLQPL